MLTLHVEDELFLPTLCLPELLLHGAVFGVVMMVAGLPFAGAGGEGRLGGGIIVLSLL